jgi:hypothetical protein
METPQDSEETYQEVTQKEKRQKRIQQKTNHIKRQVKIAKSAGIEVKDPHRFAKHNALDCGIPQCSICHPSPKRQKTVHEKQFDEIMKDSLKDLF